MIGCCENGRSTFPVIFFIDERKNQKTQKNDEG